MFEVRPRLSRLAVPPRKGTSLSNGAWLRTNGAPAAARAVCSQCCLYARYQPAPARYQHEVFEVKAGRDVCKLQLVLVGMRIPRCVVCAYHMKDLIGIRPLRGRPAFFFFFGGLVTGAPFWEGARLRRILFCVWERRIKTQTSKSAGRWKVIRRASPAGARFCVPPCDDHCSCRAAPAGRSVCSRRFAVQLTLNATCR